MTRLSRAWRRGRAGRSAGAGARRSRVRRAGRGGGLAGHHLTSYWWRSGRPPRRRRRAAREQRVDACMLVRGSSAPAGDTGAHRDVREATAAHELDPLRHLSHQPTAIPTPCQASWTAVDLGRVGAVETSAVASVRRAKAMKCRVRLQRGRRAASRTRSARPSPTRCRPAHRRGRGRPCWGSLSSCARRRCRSACARSPSCRRAGRRALRRCPGVAIERSAVPGNPGLTMSAPISQSACVGGLAELYCLTRSRTRRRSTRSARRTG